MSTLFDKLASKPDRQDLEKLEEELRRARAAPDPSTALEALYTKVWQHLAVLLDCYVFC